MSHLKGKVAVVTGSTSGIGLQIAESLAKQGANIVINGLGSEQQIRAACQAIESRGVTALYHGADMTRPDEIEALIACAGEQLGGVDILVNNAGIQHVAPIEDFPAEKWDAIIAINMTSAFHTIRHALPLMRQAGWGRIINIASAHGLVASPFKSAYVTAKHGIMGLTKTVALECAEDNVTVNSVCPGYVKTPLVEGQIADTARARGISEEEVVRDVLLKAQWTKKFVTVEQVAAIVLFLCSGDAENITGSHIAADGGWTAS